MYALCVCVCVRELQRRDVGIVQVSACLQRMLGEARIERVVATGGGCTALQEGGVVDAMDVVEHLALEGLHDIAHGSETPWCQHRLVNC